MLRPHLLRLGEQDHVLLTTFHHIVSDAWSVSLFMRELGVLYAAFCEDRANPLPALAVQYADFALWQRSWLGDAALEGSLAYWKEQLAEIPAQLALPADRPRGKRRTFAAELCVRRLEAERLGALKRLSEANHATLYMSLLSAFGVLLHRYTGQDDIVSVRRSPIARIRSSRT